MSHIVFYSGGVGSWATARRVVAEHGTSELVLLFTDTLTEDEDLYRFLIESAGDIFEGTPNAELAKRALEMPDLSHMEERKAFIMELRENTTERYPNLAWYIDGRDVWTVFQDKRFIGNSRIAPCSHILKQEAAAKWVKKHYTPFQCTMYLGIDWTEIHRTTAPLKNWAPYRVAFPMCEEPYVTKPEMLDELSRTGIKPPRLYEMGFAHNNCGGFCVRAGQGHFANLLKKLPERYAYHEQKEEEMRQFLGKDVSILKRVRGGIRENLTLRQLREDIENKREVDMLDIGGCGCFVQDEDGESA